MIRQLSAVVAGRAAAGRRARAWTRMPVEEQAAGRRWRRPGAWPDERRRLGGAAGAPLAAPSDPRRRATQATEAPEAGVPLAGSSATRVARARRGRGHAPEVSA
jgi:hypothetical protein